MRSDVGQRNLSDKKFIQISSTPWTGIRGQIQSLWEYDITEEGLSLDGNAVKPFNQEVSIVKNTYLKSKCHCNLPWSTSPTNRIPSNKRLHKFLDRNNVVWHDNREEWMKRDSGSNFNRWALLYSYLGPTHKNWLKSVTFFVQIKIAK